MAKVYVICDNDCKYESMTKEQIIAAIAEATGYVPSGESEGAFISQILESNAGLSLSFWLGTQAQFNALGVDAPAYNIKVDETGKVYLAPASDYALPDGSVTSDKIADGAVTADKIADGAVTPAGIGASPTSHASTGTTYGKGTDSNYGHLKLSASTSSTSGVSGGIAATPSAVKSAYDLANKAMPKAGGTFTGAIILTKGVHYGTESERPTGSNGQVYFLIE